jgi:lactate dehydrogenase-like 2-hydroxyacid dehydrogenase
VTDEQWASADAIVSAPDIPAEFHPRLSRCRIFVTPKVGFDNIDLAAWGKLGIPVCNVPDYGTQEVADHAMALLLSLMKGITFHTRELKKDPRGLWRPALNPFGKRLSACVCGIVGLGRIGTAAALRAKAFGMDVVVYDPYISNGSELALGVRRVHSLKELFAQSDVVSLHVPLSPETEKLIDAEVLAASKPGLVLINTARGPIIDLDALYHALKANQLQAAGLDVLPVEPADPDHPLIRAWATGEEWIDHRLLITPHSAFFTPESVYDMRFKGGEVAMTYLTTGRLQNCVNLEFLEQRR